MTKTAQITVRLTDDEFLMLKTIAAHQSTRMSDVVRKALTREYAKTTEFGLFARLIRRLGIERRVEQSEHVPAVAA